MYAYIPSDSRTNILVDIHLPDIQFKMTVSVNLLNGEVLKISDKIVTAEEKRTVLRRIRCYDAPLFRLDRDLIMLR